MALGSQLDYERYIASGASDRALDPAAVLAVASTEGGFGGPSSTPGDYGTSFGPFQLHRGGALPADVADPQSWAWSEQGIDYALDRIAGVARGLTADAAIHNIVYLFERPADPASESSIASKRYGQFQTLSGMISSPAGTDPITGGPYVGNFKTGSVGGGCAWQCYVPFGGAFAKDCSGCGVPGGSTVEKAAKSVYGSTLGLASTIWNWLLDHLKRLGLLVGGGVLIIVGMGLIAKTQTT